MTGSKSSFNGAIAFQRWKEQQGPPWPCDRGASMGPSPFSDGRFITFTIHIGVSRLQWGHRLSAMEGRAPSSPPTALLTRFNGAIAFQRWKAGLRRSDSTARRRSFNGAIAFQRWKAPCRSRRYRRPTGFNGAIAFQRWKASHPTQGFQSSKELQWGHRLSAMEGGKSSWNSPRWCGLQWGHRLSAMEGTTAVGFGEFRPLASMGPSPFSDGRLGVSSTERIGYGWLQWGHRLSAMEGWRTPGVPPRR